MPERLPEQPDPEPAITGPENTDREAHPLGDGVERDQLHPPELEQLPESAIVINPNELPDYPKSEGLLNDPDYVRSLRRDLEEILCYSVESGTPNPDRAPFSWFLSQLIGFLGEKMNCGDSRCEYAVQALLAIQEDVRRNPNTIRSEQN